MAVPGYSRLAIASVLLHLPWIVLLGLCFRAAWSGPVNGLIFMLPFLVWLCTGTIAGICGLIAFSRIQNSAGSLRGLWLAVLGIVLATAVPLLAAAENIYGEIRAAKINATPS